MPRAIEGEAVDPISLEPVDEVIVTTLVDNSYDGLLADMGPARRMAMGQTPPVPAPQFEQGVTVPGLVAEHGFAALVTTRRGDEGHTLLFDTGVSPNGLADNLERLGIDASDDRGGGPEPRPLRPRGRLPRPVAPPAPPRAAHHPAPAGVDTAPRGDPRPTRVAAAGVEPALARVRRLPGHRAAPAVVAARGQRADHRRGRSHDGLRDRHAVPRSTRRARVGARSPDPGRPGTGRPRAAAAAWSSSPDAGTPER